MTSVNTNVPVGTYNSRLETSDERLGRTAVPRELKPQFDAAQSAFKDRMSDLKSQLANETDPKRQLQLQNEIAHLQSQYDEFVGKLASASGQEALGRALNTSDDGRLDFSAELTSFRADLIDSYDRIGVPEAKLARIITCGGETSPSVNPPPDSKNSSESGGASGADKASGSDEAHRFIGMTPDELVNLMEKDQKAFYSELREMGAEDRGIVMQQVQMHLQQMNQLFSMMSTMSQAMHDTTKAVIANLRV